MKPPYPTVYKRVQSMGVANLESRHATDAMPLGHVHTKRGKIVLNEGKSVVHVSVRNMGDRPVQVGSHYHFVETNPYLEFDRKLSFGRRLAITSGTAVRFEPGETRTVPLVEIGGKRIVRGGNSLVDGAVAVRQGEEDSAWEEAWAVVAKRLEERGFRNIVQKEERRTCITLYPTTETIGLFICNLYLYDILKSPISFVSVTQS